MSRRRSDRWQARAAWLALIVNVALFALNLAASIIFLRVSSDAAENNRRISAILDRLAERRYPKAWGGAY